MIALPKGYTYKVYNMSELQTESADIQENAGVIENPDSGAELATASESEHSENTETVEEVESKESKQQAYINKQYGEKKQLERDNAAQAAELEKFQQADRDRQAAAAGNIPPMPTDAFDENYEADLKAHIDGNAAHAVYNANNLAYEQQQQLQQQQAAQAVQAEQAKTLQEHKGRADSLGIKQEEMIAAETAVVNYGYTPELLTHLAGDKESPLLIKHLAANPQDGYQLANLAATNPYGVSVFLEQVRDKASALKPKTSNTPEPSTVLNGSTIDPDSGRYKTIKGATFE